jgi:hypothetical protein
MTGHGVEAVIHIGSNNIFSSQFTYKHARFNYGCSLPGLAGFLNQSIL